MAVISPKGFNRLLSQVFREQLLMGEEDHVHSGIAGRLSRRARHSGEMSGLTAWCAFWRVEVRTGTASKIM
jgi:hypothetical protein